MNKTVLVGVVCDEPKHTTTDSGLQILRFNVKTMDEYINKAGKVQERTQYHKCVAFGNLAKLRRALRESQTVAVEGRIETRKYQDNEGQTKTTVQIVANGMEVVSGAVGRNETVSGSPPLDAKASTSKPTDFGDDDIPF